jgi:hypothetical protein
MTAGCHDAIKASHWQTFDAGMCLGIIKAFTTSAETSAFRLQRASRRLRTSSQKYVDSHTGKTQEDFRETSLEAMRSAWSCGVRHDI